MGFVLNKPSELYIDEIIEGMYSFRGKLFIGGLVSSWITFNHFFTINQLGLDSKFPRVSGLEKDLTGIPILTWGKVGFWKVFPKTDWLIGGIKGFGPGPKVRI